MAADILLNNDWEKVHHFDQHILQNIVFYFVCSLFVLLFQDLPYDPTGKFNDFRDFVESNFDMFKWIGLLIILAQVLRILTCLQQIFQKWFSPVDKFNYLQAFSILLATALRSIGPEQVANCDSDEEYAPARVPLMNHVVQPPEYIVAAKNTSNWNVRIHS